MIKNVAGWIGNSKVKIPIPKNKKINRKNIFYVFTKAFYVETFQISKDLIYLTMCVLYLLKYNYFNVNLD